MNYVQNFECCWKYSIFGRNSWVLKVLAHEKSGEIPQKNWDLKSSWYDEGKYLLNLIKMNDVQNFGCWWKYLVFGRNSWVLKVLAHEKRGEIPKNIEILNFVGMMKGNINKTFLRWKMCKILSVVGNIQYLVEILEF